MFSRMQEFFDAQSERIPVLSLRRQHLVAALMTSALVLQGCATTEAAGQGAQRGMQTFAHGVKNLMLSPFMIVSGLAQGLAFLPYTVGTSLDELNRGLIKAQAVSLDDAYRATYGVDLADARVNRQTGDVAGENFGFGRHRPEAMLEATQAFQRVLMSQGMSRAQADEYAIVGDYSHVRTRGAILLAVVKRHSGMQPFRVAAKHTGIVTTFRPQHQGWASAYARDVNGEAIDEVIDWVAMDYSALQRDKVVATLLVIAAESVKSEKRSPDYWQIEQRWLAGDSAVVMRESAQRAANALELGRS